MSTHLTAGTRRADAASPRWLADPGPGGHRLGARSSRCQPEARRRRSAADKIKPELGPTAGTARTRPASGCASQQADLSSAAQIRDWNERGKAVYDALQRRRRSQSQRSRSPSSTTRGEVPGLLGDQRDPGRRRSRRWSRSSPATRGGVAVADPSTTTRRSPPRARPQGDQRRRVGHRQHQRRRRLGAVRRQGRGHRHRQHRHRACSTTTRRWSTRTAATTATARSTTTTTGSTRRAPAPTAPCDSNGHGTHTMGTMVGDDGAGNQIGVAPGASSGSPRTAAAPPTRR